MKPWIRSVGAVLGGFLVTVVASTFPNSLRTMSDPLFILASAYRALFTVVGGFVAARLAPDRI